MSSIRFTRNVIETCWLLPASMHENIYSASSRATLWAAECIPESDRRELDRQIGVFLAALRSLHPQTAEA